MTPHHHACLSAECCFFELDGQVLAQIRASLHSSAAPSTATERIKTEELAEDITKILEDCGIETAAGTGRISYSGMSVAVIKRSLLGVSQYRVRLRNFLEAFFGVRIVRIPVRMVLHGKLSVSALQLHFAHLAAYAKHFVIIAFCVRGQNRRPTFIEMRNTTGFEFSSLFRSYSTSRILRHLHHRGPQQPFLEFVAALQLLDHLMVGSVASFHHLDRLVVTRIERFTLRYDGIHRELG